MSDENPDFMIELSTFFHRLSLLTFTFTFIFQHGGAPYKNSARGIEVLNRKVRIWKAKAKYSD